jgi:hypothetical protein
MNGLIKTFATAALGVFAMTAPASAASTSIGLCNCCAPSLAASCQSSCQASNSGRQCPVTIIYGEDVPHEGNALNGGSLKELDLGSPTRLQLESFRKFLERERRQALRDYRKIERAFDRQRATTAELDAAKALFAEAMVNYNHGIHAYRVATGQFKD